MAGAIGRGDFPSRDDFALYGTLQLFMRIL